MAKQNQGGGTLMGVFIGLVIGVLLSFGVVWYMNDAPLPFRDHGTQAGQMPEGAGTSPAPLPGKPGDKVGDKPRFEFYKMLPNAQDAAPAPAAEKADGGKVAAPAEPMYLQAGSFQSAADADNLKAKLALMGVDASVQEVDIPEKGKMHRVRVGPLSSVEDMNRLRSLLSDNGIQAAPARGKN